MKGKMQSKCLRLFRAGSLIIILGVAWISWVEPFLSAHGGPCFDFVTGGGWFTCPPSGTTSHNRCNFGFNAGFRTEGGELKGHLNYIDHNTGMHVSSTRVTTYQCGPPNPNGRVFAGDCKIDGVEGFTFFVYVEDDGEPGREDRFFIELSNGYKADSDPILEGGNIQVHKNCGVCGTTASVSAPMNLIASIGRDRDWRGNLCLKRSFQP